jgi:HlyD family secretion protein
MAMPTRIQPIGRRLASRWQRLLSAALGVLAAGIVIWLVRGAAPTKAVGSPLPQEPTETSEHTVTVVRPRSGGIPRTIQQPATMHAFESVELYAMISGYLKSQAVDIGSPIKKAQVLAEINVPRDTKAYEEAVALVAQAKAQIDQAEARIKVARAQREAAAAAESVAESDLDRLTAKRQFAEKQYARVKGLVAERAADAKLADEQTSDLAAAVAAERTGAAEILSAKAKMLAADAAIDQARADAAETRANLGVAQARQERAKANLDYAKIVAPFDGVVTHRTFHVGALIRSASEGGQQPLLTVKRIDLMRVVVLVPDSDVSLTKVGDDAVVSVDSLGGRAFTGILARIARAEDAERMMRVEIDLKNPNNVLCDGMYGKAVISLGQDPNSVSVPAACVVEHSGRSGGAVFVVRDGVAKRTEVKLGADNGTYAEIRSGIKPEDLIVLPSGIPMEDGMRVAVAAAATPSSSP